MREIAAFCRRWEMLPQGTTVLCALSGGRDSMALLEVLLEKSGEWGFAVEAAHYNHRLRASAQRDEEFVRDWCRRRGVPLTVGSGDVAGYAREKGLSTEDAARVLRYQFLEDTADRIGADRIATAHHRQDNAETLLLHLLRGTGLKGLTGIPPRRGRIVRPFLEVDRREIDAYVAEKHLPYVEDETNYESFCTRNRLRLEVLPLLEEISPDCTDRIAGTALRLLEDQRYLEEAAAALLPRREGDGVTLPRETLERAEGALRPRLIRQGAEALGVTLTAAQTEAVLALPVGGSLNLPQRLQAVCRRRELVLRLVERPEPPEVLAWGETRWAGFTITADLLPAGEADPTALLLPPSIAPGDLTVGAWDGRGRLPVENGSRTVKRLFADRGIPVEKRGEHPALFLEGRLIGVFGVALDAALTPQGEGPRLRLRAVREE